MGVLSAELEAALTELLECRALPNLRSLWEQRAEQWRVTLTPKEARVLLAEKDRLKDGLSRRATLAETDPELFELWEERAAIMEFEGGLNRDEAERLAGEHVCRKPG